jgi:hypothetical protein
MLNRKRVGLVLAAIQFCQSVCYFSCSYATLVWLWTFYTLPPSSILQEVKLSAVAVHYHAVYEVSCYVIVVIH